MCECEDGRRGRVHGNGSYLVGKLSMWMCLEVISSCYRLGVVILFVVRYERELRQPSFLLLSIPNLNLNNVVLYALEWCLVGSILVPSLLIEPCSTIKHIHIHTDKNGHFAFAAFPLATNHLVVVKRELGPFARWNKLGLNLGLSPENLEVIENDYRQTDDRLEAVLLQWLKRNYDLDEYGLLLWRRLAEAVKPIDHALALTIQNRHPS